jgi:hypothetical protein
MEVIVTATENIRLTDPYFLFVFTNGETKETVTKIFASSEDGSPFPERYNEFTLEVDELFSDKQVGQWKYSIYEQESSENVDPEDAGAYLLEIGMMELQDAPASRRPAKPSFTPDPQQIKIFNGE